MFVWIIIRLIHNVYNIIENLRILSMFYGHTKYYYRQNVLKFINFVGVIQFITNNFDIINIKSTQYTVHNTQYTIHSTQYTIHNTPQYGQQHNKSTRSNTITQQMYIANCRTKS
jgi:hypothetical protein